METPRYRGLAIATPGRTPTGGGVTGQGSGGGIVRRKTPRRVGL